MQQGIFFRGGSKITLSPPEENIGDEQTDRNQGL